MTSSRKPSRAQIVDRAAQVRADDLAFAQAFLAGFFAAGFLAAGFFALAGLGLAFARRLAGRLVLQRLGRLRAWPAPFRRRPWRGLRLQASSAFIAALAFLRPRLLGLRLGTRMVVAATGTVDMAFLALEVGLELGAGRLAVADLRPSRTGSRRPCPRRAARAAGRRPSAPAGRSGGSARGPCPDIATPPGRSRRLISCSLTSTPLAAPISDSSRPRRTRRSAILRYSSASLLDFGQRGLRVCLVARFVAKLAA